VSVEDELVAAIVAAPDDDAPRLVLADWLSERGDPRGEQIAVEIALARATPGERAPLVERATTLRAQLGDPQLDGIRVAFRRERGMIDHATLHIDALLAREQELFAVAPVLRSIEVTHVDERSVAALLSRPWFSRLRSLELSWYVPDAAAVAVARSPVARGLARLSIHHTALSAATFAALGASEHLAALHELDVSLSGETDACIAALLGPGALSALVSFGVTNNTVGTAGCNAIAGFVAPLRSLYVGSNRLGHRGISAIVRSPHRRGVVCLDLDHVQTGEQGCAALAEADLQLETLTLRSSKVDDAGARRLLASSSLLASLRLLDLRDNQLSPDVVAEARERFGERALV